MKQRTRQPVIVVALLAAGLALLTVGCMGGGTQDPPTTQGAAPTPQSGPGMGSSQIVGSLPGLDAEALSTFESKDPFIQQAVPPSTTTTIDGSSATTGTTQFVTTTTTRGGTVTTTYRTTTTVSHGTTTTVAPTTTTTAPRKHRLKILSVSTVGGAAVVTLQVDNSIYKDKPEGASMSTSWGQVKILDLDTSGKVVTLLHGSETLVLTVGQQIYE